MIGLTTGALSERVVESLGLGIQLGLTAEIVEGVTVERVGPDADNGFEWRVTFLDDSPAEPYDYALAVKSQSLTATNSSGGSATRVIVTQVEDGESYAPCTGSLVVPSSGALVNGEYYYARVFAYNQIGYSLPQTAFSPEKPMTVPGLPTSVTIETVSSSELRVYFSPPSADGGDDVTGYLIEWATAADFSNAVNATFSYLDGGAPFTRKIEGLTQGTFYYVRVRAANSQGYGDAQVSTPSSLNPYEESSAPTGVALGVTSDTMLTVSFASPEDDGGDAVTAYLVEWDTMSHFNSLSASPHKGSVELDAAAFSSYTITLLSLNTLYYVRVAAVNAAGAGATMLAGSTYPALQVPGQPQSITVETGETAGELNVYWYYPRVPAHGIPCSGTADAIDDCPVPLGGSTAYADGGDDVSEFEVEYNENAEFTGSDGGFATTTAQQLTLSGLTSGRTYYARVLARNSVGSGAYCERGGVNCPDTGAVLVASAM